MEGEKKEEKKEEEDNICKVCHEFFVECQRILPGDEI